MFDLSIPTSWQVLGRDRTGTAASLAHGPSSALCLLRAGRCLSHNHSGGPGAPLRFLFCLGCDGSREEHRAYDYLSGFLEIWDFDFYLVAFL